ncbi:MAG: hypothetical protein ACLTZT_00325 [Butyricimonas faecalis]
MFWDRGISTNYVDDYESNFKITADGFPASGQLTISIYNIYVEMSGTSNVRSSLFLSHVIVTNDYGSGIDVSVNLAEKASTSHEDVDICLTDVPFVENADKMFYNGLKVAGKYTSSWACGGKTDSFLYTILKSVCSRIGFPGNNFPARFKGEPGVVHVTCRQVQRFVVPDARILVELVNGRDERDVGTVHAVSRIVRNGHGIPSCTR